jgi:hypothetical protein
MRFGVYMMVLAASLGACGKPGPPEPSQQELDLFFSKLERDEATERNSAISAARTEEARRAAAAEDRLTARADERGPATPR